MENRVRPAAPATELGSTWCLELELSDPRLPAGGAGRHVDARILVRLHGEPLGYIVLPLRGDPISVDQAVAAARVRFRTSIADHLEADGLTGGESASSTAGERHHGETRMAALPARSEACVFQAVPASAVTVVVCTRDRPALLAGTLRSLRALTHRPVEILVVDNASRQATTREVFAAEVGSDERFRYVREDRAGLSFARNRGLAEASGEIVAFTDDDARPDPEWLQGLLRGFQRRDDVACVTGLVASATLDTTAERYFDARVSWADNCRPMLWDLTHNRLDVPSYPYCSGMFGTGANFAVRASVMRELGGFDEALGAGTPPGGGEDLDAFARIILAGHWLAYEPSAIVWHTHRDNLRALRRQMFQYGTGMTAYLTKHIYDRKSRRRILTLVPRGIWTSRLIGERTKDTPTAEIAAMRRQLIFAEYLGFAAGPVLYARSRRERPPRSWDQITRDAALAGPATPPASATRAVSLDQAEQVDAAIPDASRIPALRPDGRSQPGRPTQDSHPRPSWPPSR